jgi:hypothetical protein
MATGDIAAAAVHRFEEPTTLETPNGFANHCSTGAELLLQPSFGQNLMTRGPLAGKNSLLKIRFHSLAGRE